MISKSYTTIVWNLNSNKVTPTPLGVTSDTGRGIEVRIKVDEIFQTPENTLRLAAEKEDGTAIYLTADIVSGNYLFTKLAQVFSYSGKVTARLELQQGTDFISSENFVFEVPPSIAISMIQSSSDFNALQKALIKTEDAFTGLRFISDSEKLRVAEEQLRALAEKGRASAENGRASAESERVTAEQGRAALLAEIEDARGTEAELVARLEALDVPLLENLEQRFDNLIATPVPVGEVIAEEIIDARDGELSLGAKIRSVDEQLAQKANDNIVRKKTELVGLNDVDEDIISAMQGGSSFSLLSEPKSKSVRTEKLSPTIQDKFLLGFDWERGSVNANTGLPNNVVSRIRTEITALEKGTIIQVENPEYQFLLNAYDNEGNYLTGQGTSWLSSFQIDQSLGYRIVMRKTDDSEVVSVSDVSDKLLAYSPNSLYHITQDRLERKIGLGQLESRLQDILFIYAPFEPGNISAEHGGERPSTTRVRSPIIYLGIGDIIEIENPDYQFSLNGFDNEGNHVPGEGTGWINSFQVVKDIGYRIVMRKTDDGLITDIPSVPEELIIARKNSLYNKINSKTNAIHKADSGYIDMTKFEGEHTATENELELASGSTVLTMDMPHKAFLEVEFEAKGTDANVSITTGTTLTTDIDTTYYKPYKIRVYNHSDVTGSISFTTSDTLTVRNMVIVEKQDITKQVGGIRHIAHRGISEYAPENTMPAYALSEKFGVGSVETDTIQTADGVWVLNHNRTIDARSNGTGTVQEMTYAELMEYDFGVKKGAEYEGTKIATLDELLSFCKQSGQHPYVEIKGDLTSDNVKSFVDVFKKNGMMNNSTIISYQPQFDLISPYDTNKELVFAISTPISQGLIDNMKTYGNKFVCNRGFSYQTGTITIEEEIKLAHDNGIEVFAWTVNDLEEYKELVKLGIDGITTDLLCMQGCYI